MQYIYKDRIIHIEWSIFKGTSPVREDFSRALVKCFLVGPNEKYLLDATAEGGKLLMDIPQGLPEGAYSLETIYVKNWNSLLPVRDTITPSDAPVPHRVPRPGINPNDHNTIHPHDFRGNERSLMRSRVEYAFAITSYPTEADDTESSEEVTLPLKSSVASYGYDGLSAYEIAVLRGDFDGTESEWLEWTHERIVADVKDLLQQLKDRDTRFVVKTQSQRDNLPDIKDGDEVYVTDDAMGYVLKEENGERIWMPSDYGSVTAKYILSFIADMPNFVADRAIADEFGKRIVDEYLTRDAVRNYISEIYNDLFVKNPPYIMDGYITVDMLSDAVKQLIGFGPIVNFPDDEFLTTKGGRITLKDKDYNPNSYSGMGRRILRKNMVNGVNVLTQRMMLCPNTIYVILYDYDLRGQTITIPSRSVLLFEGGRISNGIIKGINSIISNSSNSTIFSNILIQGTWLCHFVDSNWFKDYNEDTLRNIMSLSNPEVFTIVSIRKGSTYVKGFQNSTEDKFWATIYDSIQIPSNTIIDFNGGTLKVTPNNRGNYIALCVYNSDNIEIKNVTIIGDSTEHLGNIGEFGFGISVIGGENVTIDNCYIANMWGDGLFFDSIYDTNTWEKLLKNTSCTVNNVICDDNRRQGLSILSAYNTIIKNSSFINTGNSSFTAPGAGIDIEPEDSRIHLCKNIIIDSCTFYNNKNDFDISMGHKLNQEYMIIDCTVRNSTFEKSFLLQKNKGTKIINNVFGDENRNGKSTRLHTNTDIVIKDNILYHTISLIGVCTGEINNNCFLLKPSDIYVLFINEGADLDNLVFSENTFKVYKNANSSSVYFFYTIDTSVCTPKFRNNKVTLGEDGVKLRMDISNEFLNNSIQVSANIFLEKVGKSNYDVMYNSFRGVNDSYITLFLSNKFIDGDIVNLKYNRFDYDITTHDLFADASGVLGQVNAYGNELNNSPFNYLYGNILTWNIIKSGKGYTDLYHKIQFDDNGKAYFKAAYSSEDINSDGTLAAKVIII